ncbi:YybH family protein [Actinospica robiniae]|uniref:YybH family protein n=1 Tax=Actinospica robiniae TaxID=304901 RepID=UPI0003FDB959|nr:nuclear transport factor 2 family protein [Actinospica robiniae]
MGEPTDAQDRNAADEAVLRDVLDRWKSAVDAHEPERVAAVFTEDAIFQGLHPYSVGRRGVADYYASQPLGMKAGYQVLETRRLAPDLVLGYLAVEFTYTDREPLPVFLAVIAVSAPEGNRITHYQVSKLG